jgi:hypothetical protein
MTRSGVFLSIFVLLSSVCFSGASRAEGFYEMLFGGGRQHAELHSTYVLLPAVVHRHSAHRRVAAHHRRPVRFAARTHSHHHVIAWRHVIPAASPTRLSYAATPVSSGQPTAAQDAIARAIHDDPTLRPGDAYMSDAGLRVYEGDSNTDPKFVPVRQTHALDKTSKARLAAVENAPIQAVSFNVNRRPRSAAALSPHAVLAAEQKSAKSSKERFIKTLGGKTIRFVGGYAG